MKKNNTYNYANYKCQPFVSNFLTTEEMAKVADNLFNGFMKSLMKITSSFKNEKLKITAYVNASDPEDDSTDIMCYTIESTSNNLVSVYVDKEKISCEIDRVEIKLEKDEIGVLVENVMKFVSANFNS